MKPLSEQIRAVQLARSVLKANGFHEVDQALNDAGSTLAALNLNPDREKRIKELEELVNRLSQAHPDSNPYDLIKKAQELANLNFDAAISGFASPNELTK